MPSQPADTGWDFSPVLELIDSDVHDIGSPSLRGRTQNRAQHGTESIERPGNNIHLGSFSKLFEQLGLAVGLSVPPLPPLDAESELSNSDDALLPSPTEDTLSLKPKPKEGAKTTKTPKKAKALTINIPKEDSGTILGDKEELQKPSAGQTSTGSPKKKKNQARKETEKERKEKKIVEKEQTKNEGSQKEKTATIVADAPIKILERPAPTPKPISPVKAVASSPSKVARQPAQELSAQSKITAQPAPTPAKKAGAQSQAKAGAQVRPTTPVQVDPPTQKRKKSGKQDKLSRDNKPPTPPVTSEAVTPPNQTSVYQDPNFVSHGLAPQFFTPQPLAPYGYAQYAPFGTPVPYHFPVPTETLTQLQTSGVLYTPVGQINGLIPSVIQHQVHQSSQPQALALRAPAPVTPIRQSSAITIRCQVDRHFHFLNQLMLNFPEERKWLVSPMQLCNEKTTAEGIHIFVDASNIMYGYRDSLRQYGNVRYDMSFDTLALLMERRRPVAKRVFAGSHREANPLPQITKLVETSKAVGYENNVNEQVFIAREESDRKKFFRNAKTVGWSKAAGRTGSGSDSEAGPFAPTPTAPKWVEQGVDEILHLKMCQSIIDTEVPTTMVLATGDGAEAEHSDGFLAHVERALKRGWKVELVSWKQQTSGGYKNRKFRTKWGDQFKIVELDEYLESLIDTP